MSSDKKDNDGKPVKQQDTTVSQTDMRLARCTLRGAKTGKLYADVYSLKKYLDFEAIKSKIQFETPGVSDVIDKKNCKKFINCELSVPKSTVSVFGRQLMRLSNEVCELLKPKLRYQASVSEHPKLRKHYVFSMLGNIRKIIITSDGHIVITRKGRTRSESRKASVSRKMVSNFLMNWIFQATRPF